MPMQRYICSPDKAYNSPDTLKQRRCLGRSLCKPTHRLRAAQPKTESHTERSTLAIQ